MSRGKRVETRERIKNAEPVEFNGRLYRAKRRIVYRFTEDGVSVETVHTSYVCLKRNPDGSRISLTEVYVNASGEPDAVASYFATARGAVFTEDGTHGSNLFTL